MRIYSDLKQEDEKEKDMDEMKEIMLDILEDELPECTTNERFIESVHFANMVDKIMTRIWAEV